MNKEINNVYFYTNANNLLAKNLENEKIHDIKSMYSIYSTSLDSFFIDLINNQSNNIINMPIVWFEPSIKTQLINRINKTVKKSVVINIKDDTNKYINAKPDSVFEDKYNSVLKSKSILYISNNIHLINEEDRIKKHYKKEFFEYLKYIYGKINVQQKTIFIISTDDSVFNLKEINEINKFLKKAQEFGHIIIHTHKIKKSSPEIQDIFEYPKIYDYKLFSYASNTGRGILSIEKTQQDKFSKFIQIFKF